MAEGTSAKTMSPYFCPNQKCCSDEDEVRDIPGEDSKATHKTNADPIHILKCENNMLFDGLLNDDDNVLDTIANKTAAEEPCGTTVLRCDNERTQNVNEVQIAVESASVNNTQYESCFLNDRDSTIGRIECKSENSARYTTTDDKSDTIKCVCSKYFKGESNLFIIEQEYIKHENQVLVDEQNSDKKVDMYESKVNFEEIDNIGCLSPELSDGSRNSKISEEDFETELGLAQSSRESCRVVVEPFFNISPRPMPESPHRIVEEEFKANPWVMLVATIFLTKTTALVAKPVMKQFFVDHPTPLSVVSSSPSDLEVYFDTLGMRKRAGMIWRMSYQFISGKWRRASDLCGIGKYGEDAFRLFCLGHTDIEPNDRYLRLYLDWLKMHTEYTEDCSISDSEIVIIDPVNKYYSISLR